MKHQRDIRPVRRTPVVPTLVRRTPVVPTSTSRQKIPTSTSRQRIATSTPRQKIPTSTSRQRIPTSTQSLRTTQSLPPAPTTLPLPQPKPPHQPPETTLEDDHLESSSDIPSSSNTPVGPDTSVASNLTYQGYTRIPHIYVEAGRFLPNGHGVAKDIASAFKEKQDPNGYSWLLVNKDVKQFYWEDFKRRYTWDSSFEKVIETTWKKIAAAHYNQTLCRWRRHWKRKRTTPQGVKNDIWAKWMKKWETEVWKNKSETASKNRCSEPSGPGTGIARHTGGSKSILEHTKLMEKENGGVNSWKILKKFHTRKDGSFVSSKARDVNDKMEIAVANASQPLEDGSMPEVDINSLYYDVVGGEKKKQVYGLGSQASVYYLHNFPSNSVRGSDLMTSEHMKQMIEHHFHDQQQHLTEQLETLHEQQESLRNYQDILQRQQQDLARREQGLQDTLLQQQQESAKREERLQEKMLHQMQEECKRMWENMQKGIPPS